MHDRLSGCGRTAGVGEDVDAGVDAALETVVEPDLEQAFLRGDHFTGACGDRARQFERRRTRLPVANFGAVEESFDRLAGEAEENQVLCHRHHPTYSNADCLPLPPSIALSDFRLNQHSRRLDERHT